MHQILTAWLQLVDSSRLSQSESVDKFLRELGADDPAWETGTDEPLWNPSFSAPLRYSVLYWGGGPPNFKQLLEPIKAFLGEKEYVLFSVAYGLGHKINTQEFVVVTKAAAHYAGTQTLAAGLLTSAHKYAAWKLELEKGKETALAVRTHPQAPGDVGNGFPESLVNSI